MGLVGTTCATRMFHGVAEVPADNAAIPDMGDGIAISIAPGRLGPEGAKTHERGRPRRIAGAASSL